MVLQMKDIKGTTRICGLIGNPVEHSISPLIHNSLAEFENIDMAYGTFRVNQGEVKKAVDGAFALNILGMNVTVPHKQEVIAALSDIDPLAEAIGAVNTLVRTENGYKGYNTDILGLERELSDAGIKLENNRVVILGAGGAARAIAFLCADKKAAEIIIINRTRTKAEDIANAVNKHFNKEVTKVLGLDEYDRLEGNSYIMIQTSSVGLYPHNDDVIISDEVFYERASVGVDIIYNPAETMFMKLIKKQGKKAYNGLKMLLYQGVSAFELWNGVTVPDDTIKKVYDLMKKEIGIE